MTDRNDYDDIDESEYSSASPGMIRRFLTIAVAFAAVGGFSYLAYNMLQSSNAPVNEADIPVVEADNSPIRETPENPGGWQFEHQDKSVYNDFAAGTTPSAEDVAERIVPGEQAATTAPNEDKLAESYKKENIGDLAPAAGGQDINTAEVTPSDLASIPELASETVDAVPVAVAPVVQEAPVKKIERASKVIAPKPIVEKSVIVTQQKAAPEVRQYASVDTQPKQIIRQTGSYVAQLGAFKSYSDASAARKKIHGKHSVLSSLSHSVERADLGAKGVMYRLRTSSFSSETDARKACAQLQSAGQACFPVKL